MMTIFERQIATMSAMWASDRPARHAAWIRRELPDAVEKLDDAGLQARIAELCEMAQELGFVEERDELRFIRVAFLPAETLADPRNAAVITRVLGDPETPPSRRLDFVERHIGKSLPNWPAGLTR